MTVALDVGRPSVIPRATVDRWLSETEVPPRPFGHGGRLAKSLRSAVERARRATSTENAIVVVSLHVPPALAGLGWEQALVADGVIEEAVVVRASAVRPRILDWPLSLPIRFLQVGGEDFDLDGVLRNEIFRHYDREDIATAVDVDRCELADLPSWQARSSWPTVDVLHLAGLPELPAAARLSTAADSPGTAGWLERLVDHLRCRLVVIETGSNEAAADLRRMAAAVVERGGPAFVVAPPTSAVLSLHRFYDAVLHDDPIDVAARTDDPFPLTVFAGGGRTDLVRVSSIGEGLMALSEGDPTQLDGLVDMVVGADPQFGADEVRLDFHRALQSEVAENWSNIRFDLRHEGDGILPLGYAVRAVRGAVHVAALAPEPIRVDEPRFVNAALERRVGGAASAAIDQAEPLTYDEPIHLALSIGEASRTIRTARAAALLDQVLFRPGEDGTWVEVAVVDIDFDIDGDPVQQLWLPREGATGVARFTVVPRRRTVAVLRYCVYVRQSLVQSFRLAAVVVPEPSTAVPSRRRRELARLLDLPIEEVGDAKWLPRLEFSLTPDIAEVRDRAPRAVSIVANRLGGRERLTVKGSDIFGTVTPTGNVSALVDKARACLERIATPEVEGADEQDWLYGFGDETDENQGDVEGLREPLRKLAHIGWTMYSQFFSPEDRAKLSDQLGGQPNQIVQVAHVLLEKVIPWSLVYDRPYRIGQELDADGWPVEHDVCPAALPDAAGTMPDTPCGESPKCLLHPTGAAGRRFVVETVVCPNRFWGFRHQVELPAQQALGGAAPPPVPRYVGAAQAARIGVGMHAGLSQAERHRAELAELVAAVGRPTSIAWTEFHRDLISTALDTHLDLDVVYFYCHAEGGRGSGLEESLRFCTPDANAHETRIRAAELEGPAWEHRPIVVLNGCRTSAFSPDALSPFIVTFIRSRRASALLGTEISVWEQLARAVARDFLTAFLGDASAGMALLEARRRLLGRCNPLGLAYTLYGVTDLTMHADSEAAGSQSPAPVDNSAPVGSR